MSNPNVLIADATGLQTQPNELTLPAGSLSVAKNMEITRDGIAEVSRGFANFSSNLPAFTPQQILVIGGVAYLNLDSGLWYYDTTSGNWLRKSGNFGSRIQTPRGMAIYNGEMFFVSNTRSIVYAANLSTGRVRILAGRWNATGTTDATGDAARFSSTLADVCSDGAGNLYVADSGNRTIRKIVISTGAVTTLAGSGVNTTTDGTGTAAAFSTPNGICYDGSGNLYVSEFTGAAIRKIVISSTVVTTVYAGAGFNQPRGLTAINGFVYICSRGNSTFWKLNPSSGAVSAITITGTGPNGATADGTFLYVAHSTGFDKISLSTEVVSATYSATSAGWPAYSSARLYYSTDSVNIGLLYLDTRYQTQFVGGSTGQASAYFDSLVSGSFVVGPD